MSTVDLQFRPSGYEIVGCAWTARASRAKSGAVRVLPYVCSFVQPDSNPPSTPTVLVLDDEPFVRHAARRFLRGSGYACVEAETVDGAIELLRTTPVVAAMLDMRLPDGLAW